MPEKVWLSPEPGAKESEWYQGATIISGKNEQDQVPRSGQKIVRT